MAYAEFTKAYKLAKTAQKSGEGLNSQDMNERTAARAFALDYAIANIPAAAQILSNPVNRSKIEGHAPTLETYIAHAATQGAETSRLLFESQRKEIFEEAPEKGLAKLCLDRGIPVEISGNEDYVAKHNEVAKVHGQYLVLGQILSRSGEEASSHGELFQVASSFIAEDVETVVSKNDMLKNNDRYKKLTMSAAASTLAVSEEGTRMYLAGKRKEAKDKFNVLLPTDADKKEYTIRSASAAIAKDAKFIPAVMDLFASAA